MYEHKCHRLSDDIGPPDDDDIFPSDFDMVVLEEGHDAFWSTAPESILSEKHIPDLRLGKSVDVFLRIDALYHGISIDM